MKKENSAKQPADIRNATRQEERRKRRRRRKWMRIITVLTVLLVLGLLIALLVLRISGSVAKKNGTATSFLAVTAIDVEGDTRYSDEEIIEATGMYVGESLLVVNKVDATHTLLEKFPYLEKVTVSNASFSTIRISLEETKVLGAVQNADGSYMMVGSNNHALEYFAAAEELPEGTMTVAGGETAEETAVGKTLLAERDFGICQTLLNAAEQYGLTGISQINLAEKTALTMTWNGQIMVKLGNESHLNAQVQAFNLLLPTLLKNNGDNAVGTLDMMTYSDDNATNDKAIFTPLDSLPGTVSAEEPAQEPAGDDAGTESASDDDRTDPNTPGGTE